MGCADSIHDTNHPAEAGAPARSDADAERLARWQRLVALAERLGGRGWRRGRRRARPRRRLPRRGNA